MSCYLPYLWYALRHRWFVFVECCKLHIPVLGILHDWSKFRPSEFVPYAIHFHSGKFTKARDKTGYYKPTDTGDPGFDFAWFLHQKRNKHHWQYWVLPEDEAGAKILPMPERYWKEMVADWHGAARAQGSGTVRAWYRANRHRLQLHAQTRQRVAQLVERPRRG